RAWLAELLAVVGLDANAADRFPHEFSGGQRQRIAIARGLSLRPRLVILDEPVSALDVSIRAQILNLLQELQDKFNLSYVLIAHDLDVVAHMCDVIAVMYLGKIVEMGTAEAISRSPAHPYTQALFSARLPARPDGRAARIKLTGEIPSPLNPPPGCHFHTRCPHVMPRCKTVEPPLVPLADGRIAACHLLGPA
ncbi:MAG TPA: ABC transporter ATP-binding protein, partial [Stellaceae bacterium]|nr:ABC transporter ATP-binding protein [Stellaceae bacterium]